MLWGKAAMEDTLCGLHFAVSPLSFFQVNPKQTEKLYGLALDYAGLTGNETVVDAYCGAGTICGARFWGRGRNLRRLTPIW